MDAVVEDYVSTDVGSTHNDRVHVGVEVPKDFRGKIGKFCRVRVVGEGR